MDSNVNENTESISHTITLLLRRWLSLSRSLLSIQLWSFKVNLNYSPNIKVWLFLSLVNAQACIWQYFSRALSSLSSPLSLLITVLLSSIIAHFCWRSFFTLKNSSWFFLSTKLNLIISALLKLSKCCYSWLTSPLYRCSSSLALCKSCMHRQASPSRFW